MVILALVLLGAISFRGLNVELFPSINTPIVTVVTIYPGAAPDDVERFVTKPIEDGISGLSNIDFIQSTSSEGQSVVVVQFKEKANEALIAADVEKRVSAVRGQLPADVQAPVVNKVDIGAQPFYYLVVTGDAPAAEIFQVADETVRPRIEALDGVAQVRLIGGQSDEIQVRVDPNRLAGYNLTYDQVTGALARENQSRPGGTIANNGRELNVRLSGLFQTLDDVRNVIVTNPGTGPIYVKDVAQVIQTFKRVTTLARFNGQNAIALTITKSATANEVSTAENLRKELLAIQQVMPENVHLETFLDQSTFTRSSLEGVQRSLVEAVIITGLVLLVFLHTLRSTIIVLFAIPTSLLTTFLWMSILGFTLNIMSTLALVLVIGVLVDDSIVVIENIVRHLELGETPWQAALNGRSEIGLAAIAITMVDVVIFTPVAFLSGTTGGFFKQFGLVIVAAVLTSLFISFTLTPMLASKWLDGSSLRIGGGPWGWFSRGFEKLFHGLETLYEHVLRWCLKHRYVPPILAALSLACAIWIVAAGYVKFEFVPSPDQGYMQVDVELPAGSTLDNTAGVLGQIETALSQIPEVEKYETLAGSVVAGQGANLGTRGGQIVVVLKPLHERSRSVYQVIDELKGNFNGFQGATIRIGTGGGFDGASPVAVRVTGQNRDDVQAVAAQVEAIMKAIPGTDNVKNSAAVGSPEFRLIVDRERMADFRVTADQVASALRTTVEGTVATKFRPVNGDEQDIRLIANPASRGSVSSVEEVPITVLKDGAPIQVRLGQLTRLVESAGSASLSRRNRVPQASVTAGLEGTTPLNDVTIPLQAEIAKLQTALPPGVKVEMGGSAASQAEAFTQLFLALGLSILLIYMLLAGLYESLIMPFATMFSLPVAIVGAVLGLAISGQTLNLLSMIGVIVLMGLVSKNGVLLVDYTNTLRARGRSRFEALMEAGPTRLRPILMTSAALCFGLLPIAMGTEEGSVLYRSIGALVIGGMITSTALSLIVVPSIYTYFDDTQNIIGRIFRWRPFRRRTTASTAQPVPGHLPTAPTPVGISDGGEDA